MNKHPLKLNLGKTNLHGMQKYNQIINTRYYYKCVKEKNKHDWNTLKVKKPKTCKTDINKEFSNAAK